MMTEPELNDQPDGLRQAGLDDAGGCAAAQAIDRGVERGRVVVSHRRCGDFVHRASAVCLGWIRRCALVLQCRLLRSP